MRWRKLLHNVGICLRHVSIQAWGCPKNNDRGRLRRCLWLQIFTWLRFTGFFYTDLLKYMPIPTIPTNFPLSHFTGGGWCFVAENKKGNQIDSLDFCDSYRIQTCNLLIRSQMLYSVELRSHAWHKK